MTRIEFVNRSLDAFFRHVERSAVRDRIVTELGALGHGSAVIDTVLDRTPYTPLEFHGNVPLELPFEENSPEIGVLAMDDSQPLKLISRMHPLQNPDGRFSAIEYRLDSTTRAATLWPSLRRQPDNLHLEATCTRPTLVLRHNAHTLEYPSVLLHELVHITQVLSSPVHLITISEEGIAAHLATRYNAEIDAYRIQRRIFGRSRAALGDPTMDMAISVSQRARALLGDDIARVDLTTVDSVRYDPVLGPLNAGGDLSLRSDTRE